MEILTLLLMLEGKERMEMGDKKTATPTALFLAGMQIGMLFGQAPVANASIILQALQNLKLTLDTEEFSDLRDEVENLTEMIKPLPHDRPLDEGSRATLVASLSGWNRVIGERIKSHSLSSPNTLLNPERLIRGPTEWIYKPIWDKLDQDTKIDLLEACLSELHGFHTAATYLAIRAVKRYLGEMLELPDKEEALIEAEKILKGEKQAPKNSKKEALGKHLPSLLEKERELSSFKTLFDKESSEALPNCFNLINEILSPAPEE